MMVSISLLLLFEIDDNVLYVDLYIIKDYMNIRNCFDIELFE